MRMLRACLIGLCAVFSQASFADQPSSNRWMISVANPLAAKAGASILAKGGSAADAMVAVQAVLGLVEPQSSGIGGGGFVVWYNAATGRVTTLDGRETAPMDATPDLFLDEKGNPLKFFDAVVGGLSVGTPATPALMKHAHEKWGKLAWQGLFDDAIAHAELGFEVSPRLAYLVDRDQSRLARHQQTAAYFLPEGVPIAAGDLLKNRPYAKTLRQLAQDGGADFYHGDGADDMITAVKTAATPGLLRHQDLADYRVVERPAVCLNYRGHDICGMGPPSSGGLTVGQILGILEGADLRGLGADSPEAWRLIGDASRLSFADRGLYMADADFVQVPVAGLLDKNYLAQRRKLLNRTTALADVSAGTPPSSAAFNLAHDDSLELASTSHISIVDADGNALSMTTTIENAFGARVMTNGGFLLNNELTDFSFTPNKNGKQVANRVEAGKRPRSSMAPTIITKDGALFMVVGSPGGSRIIGYVATAIIRAIDWQMPPQAIADAPHLINRFGRYEVEDGTSALALMPALTNMGFDVKPRNLNSGLHLIIAKNGLLYGGADPRREGVVIGNK